MEQDTQAKKVEVHPDSLRTKLPDLISRFSRLLTVAEKLNGAQIEWYIGGSACLYVLGNDRIPQNIDMYISDEAHDSADALFGVTSHEYTWESHSARNSIPYTIGGTLRLISKLQFKLPGGHYSYRMSELTRTHKIHLQYKDIDFYLAPPEDVIIIKSLQYHTDTLQRHRHGVDISHFKKTHTLDQEYIAAKSAEISQTSASGIAIPEIPTIHKQY